MKCQKLTLVNYLADISTFLLVFGNFGGTVTTVITMRYDHLSLELFLPVGRVDYITLQIVALLVCQLNVVPTIAPARCAGDNMVSGRVCKFYILTAQRTNTIEVGMYARDRFRVVGTLIFSSHISYFLLTASKYSLKV